MGDSETVSNFNFIGSKITANGDCSHETNDFSPLKKSYDQPRQHIKKQRYHFANKGLSSQGYGFSSGHVWMWELDCEESWAPKNWCFWTMVLEKTLESPLDFEKIQPVHPKGDQSWVFIRRTDAEAETPILWPPHAKSWLIGKDPDAGKDWGQEKKGTTEDEMAGWHHWLDGHEFGWTLGVGDGQGGLAVLRFMGSQRVGHDWVAELNWTELMQVLPCTSLGSTIHVVISVMCATWIYTMHNWRLTQSSSSPHLCKYKKLHPFIKPRMYQVIFLCLFTLVTFALSVLISSFWHAAPSLTYI